MFNTVQLWFQLATYRQKHPSVLNCMYNTKQQQHQTAVLVFQWHQTANIAELAHGWKNSIPKFELFISNIVQTAWRQVHKIT